MEKEIELINKSIFKDANKNYVITGKVVKDIFLVKNNQIDHLEMVLRTKKQVEKVIDLKFKQFEATNKQLREENERLEAKYYGGEPALVEVNKLKERVKELEEVMKRMMNCKGIDEFINHYPEQLNEFSNVLNKTEPIDYSQTDGGRAE